jgi:phenylacetate-CoA ligase
MDDYVFEIVDTQTGKQLGPGEVGEIVVTPIHNKAWGLLRFGTGDISSYTLEKCACGRTAPKITGILGRAADAVKVRGMFIVAKQAEQVIGSFAPVFRYQIIIDRKDNRDEMVLHLELKDEPVNRDKLSGDINQKFQDICRVKLDGIQYRESGSIPEARKTLQDNRKWD